MQNDPLDQLRDVHLPDSPAWWPPAPGWWIVAILLALLLAYAVHRFVKYRQQTRPRRAAMQELERQMAGWQSGSVSASDCINACNALLKRLWVHVDGCADIAVLSGDEWLVYLDARSNTDNFTDGVGTILGNQRFAPNLADADLKPLQPLLRNLLMSKPVSA